MTTFAETAEKLGARKGKYEKLLDSPHAADRNTAQRMMGRIDNILGNLQAAQEEISPTDESKVMDDGGFIGPPEDPNIGKFKRKQFFNENGQTLGNIGMSALGALIQQAAVSSMDGPKDPVFSPYADFDDSVDISEPLNTIDRSLILRNRAIDKGLRDNNVIQAHKSKAFADSINAKNKVYSDARNQKHHIRRTKLYTDYRTNVFNSQLANKHNSDTVDFANNRAAATANNWNQAITNFRLGQNDVFANKMDHVKLNVLSKQFGESGVYGRMMSDPQIRARLSELYPNMF